ncbi:hypothetical protein LCGC14_2157850, partial [marine sediment metagenome]
KDEEDLLELIEEMTYGDVATIEISRTLLKFEEEQTSRWETVRKILEKNTGNAESLRRSILGYMNTVMLNPNTKHLSQLMKMSDFFTDNFYDMGDTGLTMACYHAIFDV